MYGPQYSGVLPNNELDSFAPLDLVLHDQERAGLTRALVSLYNHFSIPNAFLSERLQNVTCSFGARDDGRGVESMIYPM